MADNITVVKNKEERAAEEKELVTKIKPKLEKFLINQQVNKAAETAVQTHEETVKMLEEMTKDDADKQASKIAMTAFLDMRLWEKFPLPVELAWVTGVRSSDGKRLSPEEIKSEAAHDISGFSSYLVREWINMKKDIKKGKYPNPMTANEETIVFFWQKFYNDMNILYRSNIKYESLGNKGLLLPDSN